MGLFDSNKMLVRGIQTESATSLWASQTGAVESGYVNCKEYTLLVVSILSNKSESNISVRLFGYDNNTINNVNPRMVSLGGSTPKFTDSFNGLNQYRFVSFVIDISCAAQFQFIKNDNADTVTLSYIMRQGSLSDYLPEAPDAEPDPKPLIKNVYDGEGFALSYWDAKNADNVTLGGALENYAVWFNRTSVVISTNGLDGERTTIALNSENFPSSARWSAVTRAFIMPYYRNNSKSCRIIVITEQGLIYHNYPNRSVDSQGTPLAGDEYRFDESVVWESPDRFTPVKTTEGDDATLINTGRYRYMPGLSDVAYTLAPAVNVDNGYSNGGFPATKTVTMKDGSQKVLGRFWVPLRGWFNNSFDYMGGLVIDEALTIIGTYRSNRASTASASNAARTCVLTTQDGREWYNAFEFACSGRMKTQNGTIIDGVESDYGEAYKLSCNVGSSQYNVYKRTQIIPDATTKEPDNMFSFSEGIAINSIVGDNDGVVVTTVNEHGLVTGDVIAFKKKSGASDTTMDWIVNDTFGPNSGGNGLFFRVYKLSNTSFKLYAHVHNPNTNIPCRHIHSVDRNKDGIAISTGEQYPRGWLYYMSLRESDSPGQIKPWYRFDFVRLNSTRQSVQRGMGFYMTQDPDNTIYIGIDNDLHDLGNVVMPAGRTETFKRSSNGVFKGKLVDIDNQANFENILPAKEVAYFFKCIEGVLIYIGYLGLIAVSYDWGKNWHRAKVPIAIQNGISRYGGITPNRDVIIENLIIHLKK